MEATDFFTGLFTTALLPGELLCTVEIPARPARSGHAFLEVARRHGDYALAGVAAQVVLDGSGTVATARIALLSVGDGPVLVAAGGLLAGTPGDAAAILDASESVRTDVDPPTDIHADAAYRRQLAAVLTRRALTTAIDRARTS